MLVIIYVHIHDRLWQLSLLTRFDLISKRFLRVHHDNKPTKRLASYRREERSPTGVQGDAAEVSPIETSVQPLTNTSSVISTTNKVSPKVTSLMDSISAPYV